MLPKKKGKIFQIFQIFRTRAFNSFLLHTPDLSVDFLRTFFTAHSATLAEWAARVL